MIIRPVAVADLPQLIVLFQPEIAYQRQLSPFFDLAPPILTGETLLR